uniref:Interleukin 4 n=1 Tax=Sinocyclocheilus anshuiensis TaxID=1608454 RepID=A0A671LVD9_9TELE
MRTLMLLVLTIVAVTGLRRRKAGEKLLEEIMENVDVMLKQRSKMNLNQFVKDVLPSAGCSEKHLCQAAMVMMNTNLKLSMLHRRLFAYANYSGHHHCSVPASEEHRMEVFLTKIQKCCQELYSKLKHKRHVK